MAQSVSNQLQSSKSNTGSSQSRSISAEERNTLTNPNKPTLIDDIRQSVRLKPGKTMVLKVKTPGFPRKTEPRKTMLNVDQGRNNTKSSNSKRSSY